jgi:predicted ATP-grasp superfamily ATP-dependent carboligase
MNRNLSKQSWETEYPILQSLACELELLRKTYREMKPLGLDNLAESLEQLDQEYLPVLSNASFANELAQLRALGRQGLKTVALDSDPRSICFYSRYAIPVLSPNSISDQQRYLDFVIDVGKTIRESGRVPILNVVDGETLLPLFTKNLNRISEVYKFGADLHLQYKLDDKYEQYLVAQRARIPVPNTWKLDEHLINYQPHVSFPALIKPRRGREFYREHMVQAVNVEGWSGIRDFFNKNAYSSQFILQEIVEVPEEKGIYNCGAYSNHERRPVAVFTGRRIRTSRPFGTAALAESYDQPRVRELGIRFLETSKYHGACEIEFMTEKRDGQVMFIEINNRLWKWHGLASHCGVNIAYYQFLDAVGSPLFQIMPAQIFGPKWWLVWMDLWVSTRRIVEGELALADFLNTISFDFVNGIDELDDPLPGLVNLFSFKWMVS